MWCLQSGEGEHPQDAGDVMASALHIGICGCGQVGQVYVHQHVVLNHLHR